MQEKSVLELDEISGRYIIFVPDEIVEELEYWDEGDRVMLEVFDDRAGDNYLKVTRI